MEAGPACSVEWLCLLSPSLTRRSARWQGVEGKPLVRMRPPLHAQDLPWPVLDPSKTALLMAIYGIRSVRAGALLTSALPAASSVLGALSGGPLLLHGGGCVAVAALSGLSVEVDGLCRGGRLQHEDVPVLHARALHVHTQAHATQLSTHGAA